MGILYKELEKYSKSDYYGFHMPGHKRNKNMLKIDLPYEMDITEIEGFDDLHHAAGVLKQAQERAAKVYGADETHFLINGSTVGILSAILGTAEKGDTILVARNCHKSVYHAIYMNELRPVYLYPNFNEEYQLNTEIPVSAVETALKEHSQIRAVVIVSPTYDGVISDIGAIAELVHEKGIPLIVDEAHGAHFGFHPYFPENANVKGADIVIHSLHKTLPALTQTAVMHLNGERINRKKIRKYLHMLQSSSPSYILMASIDSCIGFLENPREEYFEPFVENLDQARKKLSGMKRLHLAETDNFDRSKLVISVKDTDITSKLLYRQLLNEYHLQLEMMAGTYVLAMTSVGDTGEGFLRLTEALCLIDEGINKRMRKKKQADRSEELCIPVKSRLPRTETVYTSAQMSVMVDAALVSETKDKQVRRVPWKECSGYVSTEYAYLYPPGSPLLVPGEKITEEIVEVLLTYDRLRFSVEGPEKDGYIEVWIDG